MKIELNEEEIMQYKNDLKDIQEEILVGLNNLNTEEKQPFYQYLALISTIYENVDYGVIDEKSLELINDILNKKIDIEKIKYFNIKNIYFDKLSYDKFLYCILKGVVNDK